MKGNPSASATVSRALLFGSFWFLFFKRELLVDVGKRDPMIRNCFGFLRVAATEGAACSPPSAGCCQPSWVYPFRSSSVSLEPAPAPLALSSLVPWRAIRMGVRSRHRRRQGCVCPVRCDVGGDAQGCSEGVSSGAGVACARERASPALQW